MSKIDIKHAFRLLPVKPSNWKYLGYFWEGCYFVDTRLPFGLCSSPCLFNYFADLVCWICTKHFYVKNLVHYADDYFLASHPGQAKAVLSSLTQGFKYLKIPLAEDKLEGPVNTITYSGITINAKLMTISVPVEKYNKTSGTITFMVFQKDLHSTTATFGNWKFKFYM